MRQESEVASVIVAGLAELFAEDAIRQRDVAVDGRLTLKRVPYFSLGGKVVWGATAMMLSEFRSLRS